MDSRFCQTQSKRHWSHTKLDYMCYTLATWLAYTAMSLSCNTPVLMQWYSPRPSRYILVPAICDRIREYWYDVHMESFPHFDMCFLMHLTAMHPTVLGRLLHGYRAAFTDFSMGWKSSLQPFHSPGEGFQINDLTSVEFSKIIKNGWNANGINEWGTII